MRLPLIIIIAALLALAHGSAVAGPPSADPSLTRFQEDEEQPMKPKPNKKPKRIGKKPTKNKPVKGKPVKRPRPRK